mgnify:CR=1 FL=1|jgi:hypothetical protein
MLLKTDSKIVQITFVTSLLALVSLALPSSAKAADDDPLAVFSQWRVFVEGSGAAKTCFIMGEPVSVQPAKATRGSVFMTIAHRPGQGIRNEVAVSAGYPFSSASNPFAKIDSQSYNFFTGVRAQNGADDWAWLLNLKDQKRLVSAMKRGSEMVFKGTSARRTLTTDTYSLRGVTAAMKALDAACPAP